VVRFGLSVLHSAMLRRETNNLVMTVMANKRP